MSEPIDCREAKARLHDFLQQELTPDLEEEMRAHIERCRHCFQHYRFEENFFLMLETRVGKETCPDKLRRRIVELLRAEAQRG
jgi:anti-sigma factor (TIGR02949 family)